MSDETPSPPRAASGQGADHASAPLLPAGATAVTSQLETTDERATGAGAGRSAAMRAAKLPRSNRGIATLGILLALVLAAVGVLAVRDALLYADLLGGTPLLHRLATVLQGLRPSLWTIVVGVVLVVVGLALLMKALWPSAPKVTALEAATGVFLRPRDVTRLVETAVENVDGVLSARVSTTPRRVTVDVRFTGDEGVSERVRTAVAERLAPLRDQPAVRVRMQGARR